MTPIPQSSDISPIDYLDFIRKQVFCCTCLQDNQIEPSHLESVGMGRDRKKELLEHYSAIPQCRKCHSEFHQLGLNRYQDKHRINLFRMSQYYLTAYLYKKTNIGVIGAKQKHIIQHAEA
jgi:hypothetical protein